MKFRQWIALEIPGLNGNAWQVSAVQPLSTNTASQIAIYVSFIQYGAYSTLEESEGVPIQANEMPKAEIHLWANYVETGGLIIPDSRKNVLNSCEEGWWFSVNP